MASSRGLWGRPLRDLMTSLIVPRLRPQQASSRTTSSTPPTPRAAWWTPFARARGCTASPRSTTTTTPRSSATCTPRTSRSSTPGRRTRRPSRPRRGRSGSSGAAATGSPFATSASTCAASSTRCANPSCPPRLLPAASAQSAPLSPLPLHLEQVVSLDEYARHPLPGGAASSRAHFSARSPGPQAALRASPGQPSPAPLRSHRRPPRRPSDGAHPRDLRPPAQPRRHGAAVAGAALTHSLARLLPAAS